MASLPPSVAFDGSWLASWTCADGDSSQGGDSTPSSSPTASSALCGAPGASPSGGGPGASPSGGGAAGDAAGEAAGAGVAPAAACSSSVVCMASSCPREASLAASHNAFFPDLSLSEGAPPSGVSGTTGTAGLFCFSSAAFSQAGLNRAMSLRSTRTRSLPEADANSNECFPLFSFSMRMYAQVFSKPITLPLVPRRGPSKTSAISPRASHNHGLVSWPLRGCMTVSSPTSAESGTTCTVSA
mmetsp:Transcript_86247/g.279202  ORF Transcript_86247/g.279202 Transcript_86247/m.279202 type:complete len:242 (+) Transcript_86247:136-861(+)